MHIKSQPVTKIKAPMAVKNGHGLGQQYGIDVFSVKQKIRSSLTLAMSLMNHIINESERYIDKSIVKTKACKKATPNSNTKIAIKEK